MYLLLDEAFGLRRHNDGAIPFQKNWEKTS